MYATLVLRGDTVKSLSHIVATIPAIPMFSVLSMTIKYHVVHVHLALPGTGKIAEVIIIYGLETVVSVLFTNTRKRWPHNEREIFNTARGVAECSIENFESLTLLIYNLSTLHAIHNFANFEQ